MQRAAILTKTPALPKEKRAFGKPPPFALCHITQKIVMTYEQVNDTETKLMMALKPTSLPKLMHVMTPVAAMTVHSAACGTSASGTCFNRRENGRPGTLRVDDQQNLKSSLMSNHNTNHRRGQTPISVDKPWPSPISAMSSSSS